MEINEKILKIVGSANLSPETEMEIDQDKMVNIAGAVVDIRTPSNQDGTVNKVYVIKIISAEVK